MNDPADTNRVPESIEQQAAAWVLRCDRGLTPGEQDAYSEWLGADPRHGAQLARHRRHWKRLDRLAQWRPEHSAQPNPDLLAPPLRVRFRRMVPAVAAFGAAAALIAIVWVAWPWNPAHRHDARPVVAYDEYHENQRVLADGSIIELNRGAVIRVEYAATERRVWLERGEAHFTVAKDPARPFVVGAGSVAVRAVGTAFNVSVDAAAVEVLVTEGSVELNSRAAALRIDIGGGPPTGSSAPHVPILTARQRAVISLAAGGGPPQIATLTVGEIDRVLAWQHRLLDFTATPLTEVVAEFNRRNVMQLVLIDPELAAIRVSATIRSDNVDGFVRLLEVGFGARAERRGRSEILLRKASGRHPPE